MAIPIRKTGTYPPLQAALKEPGVQFEHNAPRYEGGFQWVAFVSDHIVGHIHYTADKQWLVSIIVDGWPHYRDSHSVYTTALVAFQRKLARAGARPKPRRLLY